VGFRSWIDERHLRLCSRITIVDCQINQ
jgi:hypothetical protein